LDLEIPETGRTGRRLRRTRDSRGRPGGGEDAARHQTTGPLSGGPAHPFPEVGFKGERVGAGKTETRIGKAETPIGKRETRVRKREEQIQVGPAFSVVPSRLSDSQLVKNLRTS